MCFRFTDRGFFSFEILRSELEQPQPVGDTLEA